MFLDNIAWNTLQGPHAKHSQGTSAARRYARGFPPIIAFPNPSTPDFRALERFCGSDEHFYIEGWTGTAPDGWRVEGESPISKMIWAGDAATTDVADQAIPLTIEHVDQALKLISLTQPGPFGPRTLELGNYFGYFEEGQLVAMAGERMFAGSFREISGVCTHPRFQARGLARRIVMKLVTRQLGRGETPFLHVVSDNQIARSLYLRMGFQEHRQTVVRVVSR